MRGFPVLEPSLNIVHLIFLLWFMCQPVQVCGCKNQSYPRIQYIEEK
jgi:hypothetical protein